MHTTAIPSLGWEYNQASKANHTDEGRGFLRLLINCLCIPRRLWVVWTVLRNRNLHLTISLQLHRLIAIALLLIWFVDVAWRVVSFTLILIV